MKGECQRPLRGEQLVRGNEPLGNMTLSLEWVKVGGGSGRNSLRDSYDQNRRTRNNVHTSR
jgi:hypothetical protein